MKRTDTRPRAPRLPAAQRREQILDAALKIVALEGLGGVSMESVARSVGVAKTVVYEAFPQRDALITALLRREHERAVAFVAAAFPAKPAEHQPDELLMLIGRTFLEGVRENPDSWRLIMLPPNGTPLAIREEIEAAHGRLVEAITPLVAWGLKTRGGPLIDPGITAHLILTGADNLARLILKDPDYYSAQRLEEFALTLLSALGTA